MFCSYKPYESTTSIGHETRACKVSPAAPTIRQPPTRVWFTIRLQLGGLGRGRNRFTNSGVYLHIQRHTGVGPTG